MTILPAIALALSGVTAGFLIAAMVISNKVDHLHRQLAEANGHLRHVTARLRIFGVHYLPGEAFLDRQGGGEADA